MKKSPEFCHSPGSSLLIHFFIQHFLYALLYFKNSNPMWIHAFDPASIGQNVHFWSLFEQFKAGSKLQFSRDHNFFHKKLLYVKDIVLYK